MLLAQHDFAGEQHPVRDAAGLGPAGTSLGPTRTVVSRTSSGG